MSIRHLFLGIDTSNYKTSLAVIDDAANILFEKSELLEVKKGSRGLRQSEAFFQHSMRLPEYIAQVFDTVSADEIVAIGHSARPRRQQGSYMPCFNAGINAAKILSSSLKIPSYPFSHQEGHAAAVIPLELTESVAFMHLSGGTTEFIILKADDHGYETQIVGGTKDISFGQLLDRTGVALGFPFPSGKHLDEIAYDFYKDGGSASSILPRVKIDDGHFNLSGAETRLMTYIGSESLSCEDTESLGPVTTELFRYISDILIASAEFISEKYMTDTIYMAGGVASSKTVREMIGISKLDIRFGDPILSGDNAVGIARLAKRIYSK